MCGLFFWRNKFYFSIMPTYILTSCIMWTKYLLSSWHCHLIIYLMYVLFLTLIFMRICCFLWSSPPLIFCSRSATTVYTVQHASRRELFCRRRRFVGMNSTVVPFFQNGVTRPLHQLMHMAFTTKTWSQKSISLNVSAFKTILYWFAPDIQVYVLLDHNFQVVVRTCKFMYEQC
jgi:hypothetical protein